MLKTLKRFILILIFLTVFLIGSSVYYSLYHLKSKSTKDIDIEKGMSVANIASLLAKEGLIKTPKLFIFYAKFSGVEDRLKAGLYEIKAGMTLKDVIEKLVRGDVKKFEFMVAEGKNLNDIYLIIRDHPMLGGELANEFLKLISDKAYILSFGLESPTLEGCLFPDTYFISRVRSAREIVDVMVKKFKAVYEEEKKLSVKQLPVLTDHDRIVLASIVEKETGDGSERPVIASVFYNRLKIGMPLQSDPTVIYGLKNFDGNIRREDLSNPHPYNTYVHKELPPGAICNPGRLAIRAVLNPADTDYLYFVSKNDGTHIFSSDLKEHARAVMKYQLGK